RRRAATVGRRDAECSGGSGFRGGGADPRSDPRLVAGARAPRHPRPWDRRCRRHCGASGRRADLRPGFFLSRRPELGQSRVFPVPRRGDKKKLVDRIVAAAREALGRRLAESSSQRQLLDGVAAAFGLDGPLNRIEVYDNSHIQGTNAVGAMIVAGPDGLVKNAYRKFTIRGLATSETAPHPREGPAKREGEGQRATDLQKLYREDTSLAGGDDYALMREVLQRRFARALKEDPERDRGSWPDL